MLTFKRGGLGLPLAGLFLFCVGGLLAARCLALEDHSLTSVATAAGCLIPGFLMMALAHTVTIDPNSKSVRIATGLRVLPKHSRRSWTEFESVIAFEPRNSHDFGLYLKPLKEDETRLLIQQYSDLEKLYADAKAVAEVMELKALRVYDGESVEELT